MPFDALTLHAVHDELLARRLVDGYVERVVQSGPAELVLQVYCRPDTRYLVVSAQPERERICLVQHLPPRLETAASPFFLLVRKYVRGSVVRAIVQPRLERLLRLELEQRDEGTSRRVSLIIEVMGRRSNALLVDEVGEIMDALKRVPPARNPARPLLPHQPYLDPPPQPASLDPRDPRLPALLAERALGASVSSLAQFLVAHVRGFSPPAAREASSRAVGAVQAPLAAVGEWDAVAEAVGELTQGLDSHVWEPCVAQRDGHVVAFAPYRLTHLQDVLIEPEASISRAIERSQDAARAATPAYAANVGPLLRAIAARQQSVARRASALRRALEQVPDAEPFMERGNAILASLAQLRPGQASFDFAGREYELDPAVAPKEQARGAFRAYRRARDARKTLPSLLETAERELAHLADWETLIGLSRAPQGVRALKAELAAAGLLGPEELRKQQRRARKQPSAHAKPLREQRDGFEILIGTSAGANEAITFRVARGDDVWLHARGTPGAHVVVRTAGRPVPAAVLERAATLAAAFSAARMASRVEVDWTLRRHVRKVPGGPPGLVTYTEQRSLNVIPASDPPV